jgi:hypothetical protein
MQVIAVAAELVGEGAHWCAIAEGVMVPLPRHRAGGIGDLMRRAKMIRRDIELPGQRERGDRQIAEPRRLPYRVAVAVVFAGRVELSLGPEPRAVVQYHFSDKLGFFIELRLLDINIF